MSEYNFKASQLDLVSMNAEQYLNWLEIHSDIEEHPVKLKDFFLITNDAYSQCVGQEFLLMHGYERELKLLIEKNKVSKIKQNQEWADFYQLIIDKQNRIATLTNLLKKAQEFETNDQTLQCVKLFFVISVYYDLFENDVLANKLDEILSRISKIKDQILVPLFNQRLELVLFNYYWRRNEMILARKHGFLALAGTNNSYHQANLHVNLGLSYIFDEFESAEYHINEALSISEKHNITRLIEIIKHRNMPFIYAHFNQPNNLVTTDKSEQAHLAIARNDLLTAQTLLSEVTEVTPFTKYYLGRAYQDRRLLLQSYNEFLEHRSDHFFARLPLMILKNM